MPLTKPNFAESESVEIVKRIEKVREDNKLSQRQFAIRAGLSQGVYNMIANGKRPLTWRFVKKLCIEYGVNEKWLLTGRGPVLETNVDRGAVNIVEQNRDSIAEAIQALPLAFREQIRALCETILVAMNENDARDDDKSEDGAK